MKKTTKLGTICALAASLVACSGESFTPETQNPFCPGVPKELSVRLNSHYSGYPPGAELIYTDRNGDGMIEIYEELEFDSNFGRWIEKKDLRAELFKPSFEGITRRMTGAERIHYSKEFNKYFQLLTPTDLDCYTE